MYSAFPQQGAERMQVPQTHSPAPPAPPAAPRRSCEQPGKGPTIALKFDTTTSSGQAVAELFVYWCELRGEDPEGEVDGGFIVHALSQAFEALGLDIGGPPSQLADQVSDFPSVTASSPSGSEAL
ncbi:hypothetical protein [Streptacidiphilus sp. EB103A]|uniref:hypothetical protein n=1 Tax=Streptacidiphilus sp. EB103A TaxID=3156275 RepID=UPI003518E73E